MAGSVLEVEDDVELSAFEEAEEQSLKEENETADDQQKDVLVVADASEAFDVILRSI